MIRAFFVLLIIAATYGIGYWLVDSAPDAKQQKPSPSAPLVVAASKARLSDFQSEVKTFGSIGSSNQTDLQTEVAGKVIWINPEFAVGRIIEAGDVLLRVDPRDYEIALRSAKAKVASAKSAQSSEASARELAIKDWKRLGQRGSIPPKVARSDQKAAAEANYDAAQAEYERAELNLERTELGAPFRAKIIERRVGLAQLVNSQTVVAQLSALDALELRLPVSAKSLTVLGLPTKSQPIKGVATLDLDQPYKLALDISAMDGTVDNSTKEVVLIAKLDLSQHSELLELPLLGQWVEASLQGKRFESVLVVPRDQLASDDRLMLARDGKLTMPSAKMVFYDRDVAVFDIELGAQDYLIETPITNPIEGMRLRLIVDGQALDGEQSPAPKATGSRNKSKR